MGRAIGGSAAKAQQIAEAHGVDDFDGHALAGFIEAEGSFAIRPNNGGTSWICGLTLTQRADDADMLADVMRVTGIGRLHSLPERQSSRPQVCWSVQSKLECRELVGVLERYPLRGRKRREFEVWAAAVGLWADSLYGAGGPAMQRRMRRYAADLHALRRYVDHVEGRPPRTPRSDGLVAFLGGFFTGEGSLRLDGHATACIHLRADDADLLSEFQRRLGLGRISFSRPRGCNPSVRWTVCRRAELPDAIALLDAAMLRGRKRREFEAWRVGAAEYARGRDRDESIIDAARARLHDARAYVHRGWLRATQVAAPTSYLEILRTLAAEEPEGELTAAAYARGRERHPHWPTRNTIAAAFGGWARALGAAGLASRVSGRARVRAR